MKQNDADVADGTRYLFPKERIARLLGVSVRSIDRATVIMNAAPDLFQQMGDGKISLHVAEGKLRARESQSKEADIVVAPK